MNITLFFYIFNFSHNYFIGNSAVFIDTYTYGILFLIVLLSVFFTQKPVYTVSLLFLSSTTAWLLAHLLKLVFHVARPFAALGVTPLVYLTDFSFPSEHSAVFSAIAVAMYFVNKRFSIVLLILALLVGLSRIVLGVHYPIDVLVGFILGTLVAIGWGIWYKKV